jgi:flagellar biosynthesis component FlhA
MAPTAILALASTRVLEFIAFKPVAPLIVLIVLFLSLPQALSDFLICINRSSISGSAAVSAFGVK